MAVKVHSLPRIVIPFDMGNMSLESLGGRAHWISLVKIKPLVTKEVCNINQPESNKETKKAGPARGRQNGEYAI